MILLNCNFPIASFSRTNSRQAQKVPIGPEISALNNSKYSMSSSVRRLEVLKNCVSCIFENKIADALKTMPAVLQILRSRTARLTLCYEFSQQITKSKVFINNQQFDLVVKLFNCALGENFLAGEQAVAAALLPLATSFCRKLSNGVAQFVYTCIQDHGIWHNQQFWEDIFYLDVQKDITNFYSNMHGNYNFFYLRRSS